MCPPQRWPDPESSDLPPVLAGQLAALIAAAVSGCPGVVRLQDGPVGTYLPGRVVSGVAVRDGSVVVAVTVTASRPLADTAREIRGCVAELVPGSAVDVLIEDIDMAWPGQAG
jgi:hypothetical protein